MQTKKSREEGLAALLERDDNLVIQKTKGLQNALIHLRFEGKASLGKNLRKISDILRFFNRDVDKHMREEEKALFPYLQNHLPKLGSLISLLQSEHREVRRNMKCFHFLLGQLIRNRKSLHLNGEIIENLKETGSYLTCLLQGHLMEESEILYRAADHGLHPIEKENLVRKIKKCR